MTRIGRDHGRFKSEVEELDMEEIQWYEAVYRVEREDEERRAQQSKVKKRV